MLDDLHHAEGPGLAPPLPSQRWTAEQYLNRVHPPNGRGSIGALVRDVGTLRTYTWRQSELDVVAGVAIEQEAYFGLNRYYGPRGGGRQLAVLNALWLDLDTYKAPRFVGLPRDQVLTEIRTSLAASGLPRPSFIVDSGRGFYTIWLISGAVPSALPRWRAAMRALTTWARPLAEGNRPTLSCRPHLLTGDKKRRPSEILREPVRGVGPPQEEEDAHVFSQVSLGRGCRRPI